MDSRNATIIGRAGNFPAQLRAQTVDGEDVTITRISVGGYQLAIGDRVSTDASRAITLVVGQPCIVGFRCFDMVRLHHTVKVSVTPIVAAQITAFTS
jgi:hypothetical protein